MPNKFVRVASNISVPRYMRVSPSVTASRSHLRRGWYVILGCRPNVMGSYSTTSTRFITSQEITTDVLLHTLEIARGPLFSADDILAAADEGLGGRFRSLIAWRSALGHCMDGDVMDRCGGAEGAPLRRDAYRGRLFIL